MTKLKNAKMLERYAAIMLEIKEKEAERDAIKAALVKDFEAEGIEKIEHPAGTFSLMAIRTWKYSDRVKKLQEKVKLAQIGEQEKGIAKSSVSSTLRFTAAE